jgi:hypothetical protein
MGLALLALPVTLHCAPLPVQMPPAGVDGPIEALPPGGFLWAPDIAPHGPVTVIISLATQRAYTYRNGAPIGVSTVSTGAPGHRTPTGVFVILQKAVTHKSNKYSDAPMPFMQRLTWDGIALHAGRLPGYPASHGCIRLPLAFAKLLFGITRLGLTVVITDNPVAPEFAPVPGLLADRLDQAPANSANLAQSFRWQPQAAPSGPVTIIVSGRDRRIVVLRNGVEMGSCAIVIDGPVTTTEAFSYAGVDAAGPHWLRLPLPGPQPVPLAGAAHVMSQADHARGHVPNALRQNLLAILQPGDTMLITRDSLRSSGAGIRLTVMAADDK